MISCTICNKSISGIQIFGDYHLPVCRACNSRWGEELLRVARITRHATPTRLKRIDEIRADNLKPQKVIRIERQIKALEAEQFGLQAQLEDIESEIYYIGDEIEKKKVALKEELEK